MKILTILSCTLFLGLHSAAQVNKVQKVKVIDSLTLQPVIDGKVILTIKSDTLNTLPIQNGYFSLVCNGHLDGSLTAFIICPNYDTLRKKIDSSFCNSDSTSIIKVIRKINMLKEVIVTAPLIKQDIDKITYNVASDSDSRHLNLLELMPKLPFISLSPDDNPLFKGKSNFLVLLNGRRSNIFSNKTLRDALKAIAASNISKIEIITDPPPRFENEGYIGVINIVTRKNPANGYNASINASAGTFISGINTSLNLRKYKFGFTFEGGGNLERTPFNNTYSQTYYSNSTILQTAKNKVRNLPTHINLLFSYEIDSLNLITLDLGGAVSDSKHTVQNNTKSKVLNNPSNSTYLFHLNKKENSNELALNFNYQKNFKNLKDRLLTFSYLIGKANEKNNLSNTLIESQNFTGNNYLQISNGTQLENALQLDYVHPIRKLKIESGAKYIHRNIQNNFSTEIINPVSGISFLDTLNTDNLNYSLSILGFYNSYLLKLKSISFRAGFRGENTSLNGSYKLGKNTIHQLYWNVLPSLKIQYKGKNSNIFSISFKQQVQRPGIGLLNPLIVKTAPGFGNSGNPNLKPVLINIVNFEFSRFKEASLSAAISYTFSKNTIQGIITTPGDSIVLTTFQNIGKYNRIGTEISAEVPITPKIDFSIDGSIYYVNIKSKNGLTNLVNNGIEGFIYSYLTYRLKKFRFTGNVGYYGPTINIQAKSNSYFYSSIGVSKRILKDKGNFSFRIANPFQTYRKINTKSYLPNFTQTVEQKNLFRGFYISLNYRFGKLDEEVRRNKRSLQIDDAAGETGKMK